MCRSARLATRVFWLVFRCSCSIRGFLLERTKRRMWQLTEEYVLVGRWRPEENVQISGRGAVTPPVVKMLPVNSETRHDAWRQP